MSAAADNTMAAMPDDTQVQHGKDVRQTGFKGAQKVNAPTGMPKPAGNAQTLINDQKQRLKQWADPLETRVSGATKPALGYGSSQIVRVGRLAADDATSTYEKAAEVVNEVARGMKQKKEGE